MPKIKTDRTRKRTQARELALQCLYMIDQRPDLTNDEIRAFMNEKASENSIREYAWKLYTGVLDCRDALDEKIQSIATNWQIHRMPIVDRNILRIASYEIMHLEDIPRKVAINEAIEMAKKFSTAGSGAFVNGILDKIEPQTAK